MARITVGVNAETTLVEMHATDYTEPLANLSYADRARHEAFAAK
jgi:hypothetical protein